MLRDRYGLSLSTSSAAATRAYVEGVDRFLAAHAAAEESFDHAVAADPGFALAHIGRARSLHLQGRGALAQAAVAQAREVTASLDRRERQHVEALGLAVAGQGARALALIREHVAEFPRDAMALAAANGVYGLIGFSGRQDRNEEMLALLASVAPAYGEDWWFLGAHGFARTEALGWKAGAPLVERSLELAPRNAHAAHAFAHVLYERGDDESGAAVASMARSRCTRPASGPAAPRGRRSRPWWTPPRSCGGGSWRARRGGPRRGARWPSTRGSPFR